MKSVLLVEDERTIRESVAFVLARDGFNPISAATLAEARSQVGQADLVILDLMLPDGSGLDFLRELRIQTSTPVIIVTSRDEEADRVVGLEMGADDYVTKPFSPRELVARVRAVLRRSAQPLPHADATLRGPGDLRLEPTSRKAFVSSTELALSKTEFELAAALLRQPGRAFTRAQLIDAAWEDGTVVTERTVDVHIKALRRKIHESGGRPDVVETVRGVGYRLRDEEEA